MPTKSINIAQMTEELLQVCRENLKVVNEELIKKAFKLSAEAHSNHFRASGDPYIVHPYGVAMIIAREIPLDDISVVAALLHDVVEDTDYDIDFIEREFGKTVAEIVDGVTKISGVFRGRDITQAENYRKMLLSMVKDIRVILVKFADRLHNMRTLDYMPLEKQRRIAKETLEIYAPFVHRFGLGRVKWELEDLAFKYLNRQAYEEIAEKIKEKRKERENYISRFKKPIVEKLDSINLKYELTGRPKHLYSIYRKMIKRNTTFDKIYDLFAIRIILEEDDPHKCFYVLGVVNEMYKPIPDRFKDYISIPKKNNYQSLHTTVVGPEGRLVEVQIRTRKMHEIAEKGVAAHWRYKEDNFNKDQDIEDWVNWVREVFESGNKDEATQDLLDSFKLNLYQDEIYVFTPAGDLLRLPIDSTPVDFAFQIHTKVGYHCIGAKVNGKIVPLNTKLHSGDQVEILTSKNQHPNPSWLEFVNTHKAKDNIRKYINKEEDKVAEEGKAIWEKKIKKNKLSFSNDDVIKLAVRLKFDNSKEFFKAIAKNQIKVDEIINPEALLESEQNQQIRYDEFAKHARSEVGGVMVEGENKGVIYKYAKCCNPIPGDPIVGFITVGEGIKIHRKDCKNLLNMVEKNSDRLVPVEWPYTEESFFVAGIKVRGEDKPGILNEISTSVTNYKNTNIRSVNISSHDSIFEGSISVYVKDLGHLNRLIERLKNTPGVFNAERFDS